MKKMITVALAATVLLTVSPAMAASFPNFDFDGSILARYSSDTKAGNPDTKGSKIFFRLNATSELSNDVSLYTRFATESLGGDKISPDFDPAQYHRSSATTIDRMGIVIKTSDFTYKIGRQDGALGQGLLFDSTPYMGINEAALDGLIAWGKIGATNLTVVTTRVWGAARPTVDAYAIDASYSLDNRWKVGGTLAKLSGATTTNFWAANTAYTVGQATFGGEYGQSDASDQNKGYAISTKYNMDSKTSAYLIYSKVESNASMAGFTAYDSGYKGMYYGLDHKIAKDYTVSLLYKDMKTVPTNQKWTSLRTTLTYKF